MTDEEVEKLVGELEEYYGDRLPDPTHYPIQFEYYLKLYLHRTSQPQKELDHEEQLHLDSPV